MTRDLMSALLEIHEGATCIIAFEGLNGALCLREAIFVHQTEEMTIWMASDHAYQYVIKKERLRDIEIR